MWSKTDAKATGTGEAGRARDTRSWTRVEELGQPRPGSPPPCPVQGAAWGKLGGRIVISLGVLLNYTTSYLSPGGAARWTDRTDGQTRGGAGEVPAAMMSPRHGPTDTSLCVAKAPQGRFYGWVPGPRSPGPRPPPPKEPRNPGPRPLSPQGMPQSRSSPVLPKEPTGPGLQPLLP